MNNYLIGVGSPWGKLIGTAKIWDKKKELFDWIMFYRRLWLEERLDELLKCDEDKIKLEYRTNLRFMMYKPFYIILNTTV